MADLPVAVVGVGHLGKEHARILSSMPGVRLVGVVDPNTEQAEAVAARVGTEAYSNLRPLLGEVKAAVVAAPTAHHHTVARDLLDAGVSLMVEKPLASTIEQGHEIVQTARRKGVVLQVGHIERFNPAFEEVKALGLRPRYIQAERHGGFTGRSMDVGAVLDLMIHDLDLVLSLVGCTAIRVEAMGAALLGGNEDMAQTRVTFADGCIADVSACRVSPEPARQMRVWAPEGFAGVDFATRKVTLMRPGSALRGMDSRRLGVEQVAALKAGLHGRYVESEERDCSKRHAADQLTRELQEFVHCVRTGARPRVDGEAGLAALGLACRVVESLRAGGVMAPVLAAATARAA